MPSYNLDIIYNTTLLCPWDCDICCVDAVHVKPGVHDVIFRSHGFQQVTTIPREGDNPFEAVLEYRRKHGIGLTLEEKYRMLNNLENHQIKMDFSGGDPLIIHETLDLIKHASRLFGKDNITLTATGKSLAKVPADQLAPYIGELNFTYSYPSGGHASERPAGYDAANLRQAVKYSQFGVRTRAETPLTTENCSPDILEQIYRELAENEIDTQLIMRLFPVGRGANLLSSVPTLQDYKRAIEAERLFEESTEGGPQVKVQCALKFLDPSFTNRENPCDAVTHSLGLMEDGTLLASPWAINRVGEPLSEDWVLGNLVDQSIEEIMEGPRALAFLDNADNNFGHCKIQSYLNGNNHDADKSGDFSKAFERLDPLYLQHSKER